VRLDARAATAATLLLAFAGVLLANLPGHLTVDSIMALHEGHFRIRESWNPAIYAWLLGVLDAIVPGAALHVALMGLMLFGSWFWLSRLAPRVSWLAPVVIAAAVATPNVLIYQGIIWKDVLFADCAILGFAALAAAARPLEERRLPILPLAVAGLAFAVAALVRQNGLILWLPALAAIAWAARGRRLRGSAALAGGWLAGVVVLTLLLSFTALPQGPGRDTAISKGTRILFTYDLAGAVAAEPDFPLPASERARPAAVATLRQHAPGYYSPQRVDFLNQIPAVGGKLAGIPEDALRSDWLGLITSDPGLYLSNRLEAFRWVLATPVIDRCLPLSVGVEGLPEQMRELSLPKRQDGRDRRLYNYATWFFDSPVMSHLTWAAVALVVAGFLLIRRRPADVPIAALQVGALGFAASFLVISLACDYRYLYALDLAAITGLIYLAMDWRLRRTG